MTMLHWVGDQLKTLCAGVPLWGVRWIFLGLYFVLMVWVVQLPRTAVTPGTASAWHEDLRIWAWAALLIQLLVYAVF